ncbi:MAG TPA: YHS domain-containing protein, partial [Terriglobales bacterium]|nr:YHS domain-containing protein [Terriglobales bacterium]
MKMPHEDTTNLVKDPVCGMTVDPSSAAGSVYYQGDDYYFCSRGCLEKFQNDPAQYLKSQGPAAELQKDGEDHEAALPEVMQDQSASTIAGNLVQILPAILTSPETFVDPVCGMTVTAARSAGSVKHQGVTYYFCGKSCVARFEADPEKYLHRSGFEEMPTAQGGQETQSAAMYICPMDPEVRQQGPGACPKCGMARERETPVLSAPAKTAYTCPMHPEIIRNEPGSCPICGMALEPRVVAAIEEDDPELRDMTRRFWVSAAITLPLFVMAMAEMFPSMRQTFHSRAFAWVQMLSATPVVLWGGWPFFQRAWASLVNRHLNMFTLIGLGTAAAYLYSAIAVLFPQLLPHSAMHSGIPALYFEAAAVIVTLVLLGQVLELRARKKTGGAIKALLELSPTTARLVLPEGGDQDIEISRVKPGDKLLIRPGEKIPVDGVVTEGN